jgi:hypothetical protein
MQAWLKISFWFSVGLFVLGGFVLGDPTPINLLAAILAIPGFFIKSRLYQVAAGILLCANLLTAYKAHQEEEQWQMRVRTEIERAQENR